MEEMKPSVSPPLCDPDVDLRDFTFMPLDVVRLRDSDLGVVCTDSEIRAALWLWCAAWHQLPAASLPDDDRVLASMAGFGRGDAALEQWLAVKDGALRGFVKCSDGRLYHSVIAAKANEAWRDKVAYRQKKEAFKRLQSERAKVRWSREGDDTVASDDNATRLENANVGAKADATADATAMQELFPADANKGTGTGTGTGIGTGIKKKSSSRSRATMTYPEVFLEKFWSLYPRQTHKIEALKAWKKAVDLAGGDEVGIERIRKAVVAFSAAAKHKDQEFLPHPATWLNKGGWDDPEPQGKALFPGYVPMVNG